MTVRVLLLCLLAVVSFPFAAPALQRLAAVGSPRSFGLLELWASEPELEGRWAVTLFAVGAAATLVGPLRRGVLGWVDALVHELGHAVAAVLVGGAPRRIVLRVDSSGEMVWRLSGRLARLRSAFVACWGYPAPAALALALVWWPALSPLLLLSLAVLVLLLLLMLAGSWLAGAVALLLALALVALPSTAAPLLAPVALLLAGTLAAQAAWASSHHLALVWRGGAGTGDVPDAVAATAFLPGPLARLAAAPAALSLLFGTAALSLAAAARMVWHAVAGPGPGLLG